MAERKPLAPQEGAGRAGPYPDQEERHGEGDRGPRQRQDRTRARGQSSNTGRILVEGVQMMKRHTRPNPAQQIKGGIAEKESAIHAFERDGADRRRCAHAYRLQSGEGRGRHAPYSHRAEDGRDAEVRRYGDDEGETERTLHVGM